jgi:Gpi18-like mannosyltransferase
MKKTFNILLLLLVGIFLFTGCTTAYNKNILDIGEKGTFEYEKLEELEKDWTLSTDDAHKASDAFDVTDYALKIDTSATGWAQATQEVDVLPNAYYLIEYTFTSSNFTSFKPNVGFENFFVSFLEDEDFNTEAALDKRVFHNTSTVNEKVGSFYFKTKNITKATLAINVGTKEHPVSAKDVTITSMKLMRVRGTEAKSGELSLFTLESDTYGDVGQINIIYIVIGALAILLIGYAFYVMFQRNMAIEVSEEGYKNNFVKTLRDSKWLGFAIVAGTTLLVRLLLDLIITLVAGSKLHANLGYELEGHAAQALFMGKYGTVYLAESLARFAGDFSYINMAVENSPIYLYVLSICGLLGKGFGSNALLATTFFIKLVSSLADVGTVILIYIMTKKHAGNIGAIIISIMYALLPVTFGISAIWGLKESMLAFSVLLTFYFMLQNKYFGVVGSYMLAFLTSWTAIIIAPIIIFYSIMQFINRKDLRIWIIVSVIAGFVLFYLTNLPFTVNTIKTTPFIAFTNYWNLLWKNLVYTNNAFNFQALLGNNFALVTIESLIVSIVFVVFIFAIVGIGYFKSKNRLDLMLMASLCMNMMFIFGNNMKPASMYFSLALMLIYAIMNKEKRVYFCFVMFAALMFVNISYMELLNSYTLTLEPQMATKNVVMYIFSSLYLVVTLLYIYVVYDLVAVKKARRIQPMTLTYLGWWKNLYLRAKKWYYKQRIKQAKSN